MENKTKTPLHQEVAQKSIGYITAAFGLVAGLAWNDAIKAIIDFFFPSDQGTIIAKLGYALIFTVILVLVTIQLNKLIIKKSE